MGTQPAKVGHLQSLGVNSAEVCRFCATKTFPPPPGLRSGAGPKLLKGGPSGRGANRLKEGSGVRYTILTLTANRAGM